jgi:hypothetical protein
MLPGNWPNSAACKPRRHSSAIALLAALLAWPAYAQETTIRTTVNEVLLDLVVRDKQAPRPSAPAEPGRRSTLYAKPGSSLWRSRPSATRANANLRATRLST